MHHLRLHFTNFANHRAWLRATKTDLLVNWPSMKKKITLKRMLLKYLLLLFLLLHSTGWMWKWLIPTSISFMGIDNDIICIDAELGYPIWAWQRQTMHQIWVGLGVNADKMFSFRSVAIHQPGLLPDRMRNGSNHVYLFTCLLCHSKIMASLLKLCHIPALTSLNVGLCFHWTKYSYFSSELPTPYFENCKLYS